MDVRPVHRPIVVGVETCGPLILGGAALLWMASLSIRPPGRSRPGVRDETLIEETTGDPT